MPNRLLAESSPYLQQHANNPVDWFPFGELAFEQARLNNKPMIISIGYSSCHWCHVMERESFCDTAIAELMNQGFVCVKVDREERPDVDAAYMSAVTGLHGQGGWPLNCFALPDGRPFWGGTYFNPQQWKSLLEQVAQLYREEGNQLVRMAENLQGYVSQKPAFSAISHSQSQFNPHESLEAYNRLSMNFDSENGGLQGAPKFPMPCVAEWVLARVKMDRNSDSRFLYTTLDHMARGGICDQVGGGFARYAVDAHWEIPHFEKMLYDNAQLLQLYAKAWMMTGKALYRDAIAGCLHFVHRDLLDQSGLYYSALDADTAEGEGAYYTWTREEWESALGSYAGLCAAYYGLDGPAPLHEGRFVLQAHPNPALFAQQHFLSEQELTALLDFARPKLLQARNSRPAPATDTKIITSWNALMIRALAIASVAQQDIEQLDSARQKALILLQKTRLPSGRLRHLAHDNAPPIEAFLDDYAHMALLFTEMYSYSGSLSDFSTAQALIAMAENLFSDPETGYFFNSSLNHLPLTARRIELNDNVMPSANATLAEAMLRCASLSGNGIMDQKARAMVYGMKKAVLEHPHAHTAWARLQNILEKNITTAIVYGPGVRMAALELAYRGFPQLVIAHSELPQPNQPMFADKPFPNKLQIYICRQNTCLPPYGTVADVVSGLERENDQMEINR